MDILYYRCNNKIKISGINALIFSENQRIVVCDDCIDWYKTGGVNGNHVELPFLMTRYDKNGVLLFDRFNADRKQENELKRAREVFFKSHKLFDQWTFIEVFDGNTVEESFSKLKKFLKENWVTEIPLPVSARRLLWDYLKPDVNGNYGSFVWHPIKINQNPYQMNGLFLTIYNEDFPNHMALWEGTYGNSQSKN
jgi:hypothetical protein